MDVFASGDAQSRRLAASGHDIYAVSAPLIVEACMRVLSQKRCKAGAFAPAELFDPADFLSALSPHICVQSISAPRPM